MAVTMLHGSMVVTPVAHCGKSRRLRSSFVMMQIAGFLPMKPAIFVCDE